MAKLNETDLKRQIKNGDFKNLYLLYGEEKMLVSMYAKKLQEKMMGKEPPEFNFHIFTEDSTVDDILPAVNIVPFTAPYNYIYIEDFAVEKMSDADLKLFYQVISELPESTVVVIAMKTLLPSGKKYNAWKKLIDTFDKYGVAIEFIKKTVNDLRKQLVSWANKRNLLLSPENAGRIIEYTGADLNTLKNEMDKLCAFVNEGEITTEHIDKIITKNLATRVFDMTDAVTQGNWDKAFERLDLLFYQREEPVMILAELSNTYTDMYRVRIALESGMRAEDVAKDFDYKRKEFRLKKAERASSKLTTDEICSCLEYLADTNTAMNSGGANKRLLLEQLVAKLIMAGKRVTR
ncbi:MAG: DNA polymerase III subunit delta [Acutalibacteraceae bacterium]|nr:DNA polymerase III subunit delta [Acutalibacteraceae bacterium]